MVVIRQEGCMKKSLFEYCEEYGLEYLLEEWDTERNQGLSPSSVSYGSRKKVWWHCASGHHWQAAIYCRTGGKTKCPYCTGRLLSSDNTLEIRYPDIAGQWHPTKNGDMTPQSVTAFSNKTVWWLCEAGHDYQTAISRRTRGLSNCPYCTNRKILPGFNDLATKEPTVAKEWHPELNGTLTPQMVTKGSRKRVWWKCNNGHVWQAVIYSRASGGKVGCPVCAGKVKEEKVEKYGEIIEKM